MNRGFPEEYDHHRFVPSRVEGLTAIEEIVVYPDRLELRTWSEMVVVRFQAIAQWPSPRLFSRLRHRLGDRSQWIPVGERDWFRAPPDRFLRFFSDPAIVVYMPKDEPEGYGESNFLRIQMVMRKGGFHTFDLG